MTTAEFLNEHLREAFVKKGITRYRIAKETGTSDINISRVFNGKQEPSVIMFFKICTVLNVSKTDIYNYYKQFKK